MFMFFYVYTIFTFFSDLYGHVLDCHSVGLGGCILLLCAAVLWDGLDALIASGWLGRLAWPGDVGSLLDC